MYATITPTPYVGQGPLTHRTKKTKSVPIAYLVFLFNIDLILSLYDRCAHIPVRWLLPSLQYHRCVYLSCMGIGFLRGNQPAAANAHRMHRYTMVGDTVFISNAKAKKKSGIQCGTHFVTTRRSNNIEICVWETVVDSFRSFFFVGLQFYLLIISAVFHSLGEPNL